MNGNEPLLVTVLPLPLPDLLQMGMLDVSGWDQHRGKNPSLQSSSRNDIERDRDRFQILLVEDNRADVFLVQEAIKLADVPADVHVLADGERAFGFIDRADRDTSAPCPNLVILDLNLPKRTGNEVLEYLRNSARCRHARVLIVTSSDSEQDKANTARLGADAYFRKPSGYDAYMKVGEIVKEMLTTESMEDGN